MAVACFCGCGREIPKFPLGIRSVNKRGALVSERLGWATEVFGDEGRERFAEWFDEGEEYVDLLQMAMHGEIDPRNSDERAIRHWMTYGRNMERVVVGSGGPRIRDWKRAERNRQAFGAS